MTPGRWTDVSEQGQFLLDLEFLSRHTHPGEGRVRPTVIATTACVYTQSPPYLNEIAYYFPWVHFYAFRHSNSEYDPTQPTMAPNTAGTVHTERNMTTSTLGLTKESTVALSRVKEDTPPGSHKLVLICHGEGLIQQLVIHSALRSDASMLDIEGPIPSEYLEGDIVIPIHFPGDKIFACLSVSGLNWRPAEYSSLLYTEELRKSFPPALCLKRG